MLCTLQVNKNSKATLSVATGQSVTSTLDKWLSLKGSFEVTAQAIYVPQVSHLFTFDYCFSKIINLYE